jgi:hypothetical protein
MLTTVQKGAIAESAIAHAATKLGILVARPLTAAERYDLIFDLGARLLRVQCKWALLRGEVLVVQCHSTRRTREGFVKRPYTGDEVDALAAYSAELGRCYFLPLPLFAARAYVQLRLSPARNNQRRGGHYAHAYEFESLDWGALTGP